MSSYQFDEYKKKILPVFETAKVKNRITFTNPFYLIQEVQRLNSIVIGFFRRFLRLQFSDFSLKFECVIIAIL